MNDPENRPPEDLARFLDSARAIPPIDPATKSALFSRILVRIDSPPDPSGEGGNGAGGSGGVGAAPPVLPSLQTTLPLAPWTRALAAPLAPRLVGLFLAFSVGGVVGAIVDRTTRAPEVRTVYVEVVGSAPLPSRASATAVENVAPSGEALGATEAPTTHDPAGSKAKLPAQPAASTDPPTAGHLASATPTVADSASPASKDLALSAERSLLERARSALARGNVNGALEALGRHTTEFPRGRLSEEREAIWIQALAAGGRTGEARQRLARYKASFPRSFSLPALEAALGEP